MEKHFGRIYDNPSDYIKILNAESDMQPSGKLLKEITLKNGRECVIHKITLDDESFHEASFYLQAVLPFFIDGASMIEPSPFWNYFLCYDKQSGDLLAFMTVYEAHQSAVKFRAKISQVLVLPPY